MSFFFKVILPKGGGEVSLILTLVFTHYFNRFLFVIFFFEEFFILTKAEGFSLEFEWQQVSSSLWDSGRSQDNLELNQHIM